MQNFHRGKSNGGLTIHAQDLDRVMDCATDAARFEPTEKSPTSHR